MVDLRHHLCTYTVAEIQIHIVVIDYTQILYSRNNDRTTFEAIALIRAIPHSWGRSKILNKGQKAWRVDAVSWPWSST